MTLGSMQYGQSMQNGPELLNAALGKDVPIGLTLMHNFHHEIKACFNNIYKVILKVEPAELLSC